MVSNGFPNVTTSGQQYNIGEKPSFTMYSTLTLISMQGHQNLFGVLGPRCWTWSSMLDCHVLKGFGIYMIGILGSFY